MRFGLAFHPRVKLDLVEAEFWYQTIDPTLVDRLLAELENGFAALADDALLYRPRFADIRRVNAPVFPYGIFYFISGESAIILGVLHSAQDSERELRRRRDRYG